MTNEQLNEYWENRGKPGSPVKFVEDGDGKDSDFMTIEFTEERSLTFERKSGSTLWILVI